MTVWTRNPKATCQTCPYAYPIPKRGPEDKMEYECRRDPPRPQLLAQRLEAGHWCGCHPNFLMALDEEPAKTP